MNAQSFFAIAICAVMVQVADACRAQAQGVPDIVWQTNAHAGYVLSVAFSQDGQTLASGAEDRSAKVWTVPDGQLRTTVTTPHAWMMSVALYPPEDLLITGGDDGGIRVWSATTGRFLYGAAPNGDFDGDIVTSVVIATDGSIATARSNGNIDLTSPHGAFSLDNDDIEGFRDVLSLSFSPDASKLASASADGTAKIWDASDGALLHVLTGHSIVSTNEDETVIRAVWGVDFSPDGSLLASIGADGTTQLWRVSDGAQVRVLRGGGGSVVRFSADGKTVFTVGGDIKFWRVSDGAFLGTLDNAGATCLTVASTGQYLAYGRADGAVVLARMPVILEESLQGDQIVLHWTGGSGRYRIQRRNHPTRGEWHNFGRPTTATSFTNAITREPVFYRVVSLPNP